MIGDEKARTSRHPWWNDLAEWKQGKQSHEREEMKRILTQADFKPVSAGG